MMVMFRGARLVVRTNLLIPSFTLVIILISSGHCGAPTSPPHASHQQCGKPAVYLRPPPPVNRAKRFGGGIPSSYATEHSWPWLVSVSRSDGSHRCSGSLISPRHVVTAGHCIQNGSTIVKLGAHDLAAPASSYQTIRVVSVVRHPLYDDGQQGTGRTRRPSNDVALLTLEKAATLNDNVSLICLPETEPKLGKMCLTAGWIQRTSDETTLTQAFASVINASVCNSTEYGRFDETMLCSSSGVNDCRPIDSGSPMVCYRKTGVWELQGIGSWANPRCPAENYTIVFNHVFNSKQWIIENMN